MFYFFWLLTWFLTCIQWCFLLILSTFRVISYYQIAQCTVHLTVSHFEKHHLIFFSAFLELEGLSDSSTLVASGQCRTHFPGPSNFVTSCIMTKLPYRAKHPYPASETVRGTNCAVWTHWVSLRLKYLYFLSCNCECSHYNFLPFNKYII